MEPETRLIERIVRVVPSNRGARSGRAFKSMVRLGIGDDAAVIAPDGRTEWVLSCDAFLEGVHFFPDRHPADSVGFKSLARATSDLAAMGAEPRLFLVTLALPVGRTGKWLDEFARGMSRAARRLGMRLVGGDTTKGPIVSVSIAVLGEVAPGRALTRSGAKPGDILYVSGRLGRAELGLRMIKSGLLKPPKRGLRGPFLFLQQHLYPNVRVELGAWLARHKVASSMIDISDGLSTDLTRVCEASRVGARLWADRIPCVALPAAGSRPLAGLKVDPLQMALHGGDDYELLFTVPPGKVSRLRRAPGFREIRAIGEIQGDRKILLIGADGRAKRLVPRGWDPFRRK
jgi:thiamine-monophosphate kinase